MKLRFHDQRLEKEILFTLDNITIMFYLGCYLYVLKKRNYFHALEMERRKEIVRFLSFTSVCFYIKNKKNLIFLFCKILILIRARYETFNCKDSPGMVARIKTK